MTSLAPFHLAVPVHDIAAARAFYGELFGCAEGRSSVEWVDFDFFGHQLVAHLDTSAQPHVRTTNPVDGQNVPVPHFGVVLAWDDWHALVARLRARGSSPGYASREKSANRPRSFSMTRRATPSSSRPFATRHACSRAEPISI